MLYSHIKIKTLVMLEMQEKTLKRFWKKCFWTGTLPGKPQARILLMMMLGKVRQYNANVSLLSIATLWLMNSDNLYLILYIPCH